MRARKGRGIIIIQNSCNSERVDQGKQRWNHVSDLGMGDGYCAHGPQFSLKDGRWMQRLERLSRGAEQRNPLADRRESLKRCTVEQDSSDLQGTKFLCCVPFKCGRVPRLEH